MSYIEAAYDFAQNVVSGDKVAPNTVKLACQRFLGDLKSANNGGKWVIDLDRVDRACQFLERLPHVKGRWAAQKQTFTLSDWQVFACVNVYGWVDRETDKRRFRYVYAQVPRKNGKSFWFAGMGNYHLAADGDYGAEVYSGATSEKQAWEVFRPARLQWVKQEDLKDEFDVQVNAKNLCVIEQGSRFEPIIGNPGDGSSPSCAIIDEFHEHDSWAMYDTMNTGMGAREEPLLLVITTAGSNLGGPCKERYDECLKILNGTVKDDLTFVLIYEPDEGDDWSELKTAEKVNPNWGISVNPEFIAGQLEQARRSASKQNAYRTKHLNQWVGARTAWMNMLAWHKQQGKPKHQGDAVIAVDLASKVDLAALALLHRAGDKYRLFTRFWASEETVAQNDKYREFVTAGDLIETPGSATDYDFIEAEIVALCKKHNVVRFGYDPFQGVHLAQHVAEKTGIDVVEYGQRVNTMSEPMKHLEKEVLTGNLTHDGNAVMNWCMGNVRARMDEKENIYPTKDKKDSPNKIDGAVAAIMAKGLWLQIDAEGGSYLDTGELIVI